MDGGPAYYVTTLDRAGLAIGFGGLSSGIAVAAFAAIGGRVDATASVLMLPLGTALGVFGIVALAGPLWLALHVANRRGPGVAAALAAALVMLVLAAGQSWGFGVFAPPAAAGTLGYRLASAVATGLPAAVIAGGIGWAMQRVAYRRLL